MEYAINKIRTDDLMGLDLSEPIPETKPWQAKATLKLMLYYERRLMRLMWEQERRVPDYEEAHRRAYYKLRVEMRILPEDVRDKVLSTLKMMMC